MQTMKRGNNKEGITHAHYTKMKKPPLIITEVEFIIKDPMFKNYSSIGRVDSLKLAT